MVSTHTEQRHRTPVQAAALVVGAVFLLVGILGFVPGITTNTDQLTLAGHHSEAMLLGIFQVSVLHNAVHLIFGVAGILLARAPMAAKRFLVVGGVVYLVLWVYGLVIGHDSPANFVPLNSADNWLHFALGVAMMALGFVLSRKRA
jgi:arginine exporter protein ArgO